MFFILILEKVVLVQKLYAVYLPVFIIDHVTIFNKFFKLFILYLFFICLNYLFIFQFNRRTTRWSMIWNILVHLGAWLTIFRTFNPYISFKGWHVNLKLRIRFFTNVPKNEQNRWWKCKKKDRFRMEWPIIFFVLFFIPFPSSIFLWITHFFLPDISSIH